MSCLPMSKYGWWTAHIHIYSMKEEKKKKKERESRRKRTNWCNMSLFLSLTISIEIKHLFQLILNWIVSLGHYIAIFYASFNWIFFYFNLIIWKNSRRKIFISQLIDFMYMYNILVICFLFRAALYTSTKWIDCFFCSK